MIFTEGAGSCFYDNRSGYLSLYFASRVKGARQVTYIGENIIAKRPIWGYYLSHKIYSHLSLGGGVWMCQQLDVVRRCDLAIEAFLQAEAEFEGTTVEVVSQRRLPQDAEYLAEHGADGLPYGAPNGGYPLKLRYISTDGSFYLAGNDTEYQSYLEIQRQVSQEFLARGLTLHHLLEN